MIFSRSSIFFDLSSPRALLSAMRKEPSIAIQNEVSRITENPHFDVFLV
jgi:hypothetical protein